jgi:hypothetical protein
METQPVLEFKLSSKGLWNLRRMYLAWTAAIFLMMWILTLFAPGSVTINDKVVPENVAIWVNLVSLIFIFGICTIIQQLTIRSNNKGLIVRVNDQMIELKVPFRMIKLFYFNEVTNAVRTAQGTIHLYSKGERMTIPRQINQYDELAGILRSKFPSLSIGTLTFYHKYFFVLAFIEFTLFMSLLIFDNKILLCVNGFVFVSLLLIELRKRLLAYKIIKSKGHRNIIIIELIVLIAAFYTVIPKVIK